MEQMKVTVKAAKALYPRSAFDHVWIIDQSCGHTAFSTSTHMQTREKTDMHASQDLGW